MNKTFLPLNYLNLSNDKTKRIFKCCSFDPYHGNVLYQNQVYVSYPLLCPSDTNIEFEGIFISFNSLKN